MSSPFASRGLPRVINQICDYALVCFADNLPVVDHWLSDKSFGQKIQLMIAAAAAATYGL